ncbi:MAG: hypothetical protein QF714_14600 [Dehalococcoidia bacterium]|jgi:hypothetical protein|nr:hypothetical protein [Dehalococcoidia bacterium]MDP6228913.1 hypothetical protein [Dehalococcoidia bacterium]MDP7083325.1 hypothetical protein [Dehalococcoidia bacterium]MDP7200371.1 hypothetical protein [Dehalococcoidia bacterium]MDP7509594.1 hypothetical protein [Dehalococcoidia bacterium]
MLIQQPLLNTCCHHWDIQTANGPVSMGVCRNCSESREFKNSTDDWAFIDPRRDQNNLDSSPEE